MRMNECEFVVYNKGVDFEILSNFYFKQFCIWSRFGVKIVGTMDHMQIFVQTKSESVLN